MRVRDLQKIVEAQELRIATLERVIKWQIRGFCLGALVAIVTGILLIL